jgi:hypothetical protein
MRTPSKSYWRLLVTNPDLRRAVKGLRNQEILVPILHTALNDPEFRSFTIGIDGWKKSNRKPDGYFHPSGQATWNVRQLALFLIAPHLIEQERMQLTSVFAITQGHFWHVFLQHVLKENGILVEDEIGFTDKVHRRRGHMDGLLSNGEGLEIKTINSFKINKAISEQWLREEKYGYWCQAQEYMDVFKLEGMRFLFLSPSYPFPMKEFLVKADPVHQAQRRADYLQAIDLAATHQLPLHAGTVCCGSPENCPVRLACQYQG